MERVGIKLALYPDYESVRMLASKARNGVDVQVVVGYNQVVRTDFIPNVDFEEFIKDMCSGRRPVAREVRGVYG